MKGEVARASRRQKRHVLHGPHGLSVSIMDRKSIGRRGREVNYEGMLRNVPLHFLKTHDPRRTHSSSSFSLLNQWLRHIRRRGANRMVHYKSFPTRKRESSFKFRECKAFGESECFQNLHGNINKNLRTKRNTNIVNQNQNASEGIISAKTIITKHDLRKNNQRLQTNSSATETNNKKCIKMETKGNSNLTRIARSEKHTPGIPRGAKLITRGEHGLQRPDNIREMPGDQRTRRELKNLYDAPNITYRCSPSHKYWLFASSVAMGIYPVRVKVLQSGNIVRLPTSGEHSPTTPSPSAAATPHHRSDIPPEQEYPELGPGYDGPDISETDEEEEAEGAAPIPSPPPSALPTWPTLPSASPSTPPVRITSEWMEETLAEVKAVVDSVLKAIGSREGQREAMNDDEQITRIDVSNGPVPGVSQRGPPARGHGRRPGRRPGRRRNGTLISRGRGRGSYANTQNYSETNDSDETQNSEVSVNQGDTLDNRLHGVNEDNLSNSRDSIVTAVPNRSITSENVPVDISSSQSVRASELGSKVIRVPSTNSLPSTLHTSNNSEYVNSDKNVIATNLTNASVKSNSTTGDDNSKEGLMMANNSDANSTADVSNGASPSKQTLSSVTDLLFTVPNERVIKPAENSEVKSEIKSTEKLVRTALEDLLFRVPSASGRQSEDGIAEKEIHQNVSSTDPGIESQQHELDDSSVTITSNNKDEHSKHSVNEETNHTSHESETPISPKTDGEALPSHESTENGQPKLSPSRTETNPLLTDTLEQKEDLILRTACLPIGSIGRFKVQEVTYLVTGLGSGPGGEDCWREVTDVVKTHIKLPPMNHTTLVATTAFYFVAASANLIEPDMAYGFVRVEQFRLAANIMCERSAEHLPDPLACIDYMYIAALLSHGLQLPDHTEILVCEKIQGFRVGWALGAALNYLQRH